MQIQSGVIPVVPVLLSKNLLLVRWRRSFKLARLENFTTDLFLEDME